MDIREKREISRDRARFSVADLRENDETSVDLYHGHKLRTIYCTKINREGSRRTLTSAEIKRERE